MRTIYADQVIWVTTDFVGFHNWKDAPRERAYLADKHRHKFLVRVEVTVKHDDREIEFHDLLDLVNGLLPSPDLGGQSCEMIASAIGFGVMGAYPGRDVSVEVSEDGEVGARLTWKDVQNHA